jgi:signal transduction histidine kinase
VAEQMTKSYKNFSATYHEVLHEHLERPSKGTLERAFALGKAALTEGMEVFDLISLHHRAIAEGVLPGGLSTAQVRTVLELETFLQEALAPYKMASGGPIGARERRLRMRSEHSSALALRNARLEEVVAIHQRSEAAIRESRDHYVQLYQNARAMEAALRELSAQVLSAQEDERKRISRELYDVIGQALIAVKVTVSMLKVRAAADPALHHKVVEAEALLAATMEIVQRFARELRPAILDHLGLQSALRAHLLVFSKRTGIRTELISHPVLAGLDERREEVLFRVAQEALNSVVRHEGATTAKIEFSSTEDELQMDVGGDGSALKRNEKNGVEDANNLGLIGMQERVRHVNGNFEVESHYGSGTRFRVRIPLRDQPSRESRSTPPIPKAMLYEENICSPR